MSRRHKNIGRILPATRLIARVGYVFFLNFFWNFFVSREVGGIDDLDFGFGFTELETASSIVLVGWDDPGVQ
jgi:hypothetical protein